MTWAHVNKHYLESNLMAASPSSHLDSLYADLQVHALSVSDGLATQVCVYNQPQQQQQV